MFLVKDPPSLGTVNNFEGPEIVDIGVTCADGIAVITVTGELDLSNSSWLYECLHDAIDAGVLEVVLDVEHLTYMDSTGLSVVLGAHKRIRATGGTIEILAPTPNVARLFAVTGLAPFLTIRTPAVGVSPN